RGRDASGEQALRHRAAQRQGGSLPRVNAEPDETSAATTSHIDESTSRHRLRESTSQLVDSYDALLVDLDGVVHLGDQPIPRAATALTAARARGLKVAFVTNNAARTPADVARSLAGYAIEATAADGVTSSVVAARLLAQRLP